MKAEKLTLKLTLPVKPEIVYNAWLNSKEHSLFTGGEAKIKAKLNSKFSTWDGYISGKILELEPGKRILHSWKTEEFPDGTEDSFLEIRFTEKEKGTEITLRHWNLQPGDAKKYKQGWKEHYFEPMKAYFRK